MKYLLLLLFPVSLFAQMKVQVIGDSMISAYGPTLSGANTFTIPQTDYGTVDNFGNPKYLFKPLTPPNFTPADIVANPQYMVSTYPNLSPGEFSLRQQNAEKLLLYIRNLLTAAQYEAVLSDLTTHLSAYIFGSNRLQEWVKGTNTATYGNFSANGFPSKNYFSTARQSNILSILNALAPADH